MNWATGCTAAAQRGRRPTQTPMGVQIRLAMAISTRTRVRVRTPRPNTANTSGSETSRPTNTTTDQAAQTAPRAIRPNHTQSNQRLDQTSATAWGARTLRLKRRLMSASAKFPIGRQTFRANSARWMKSSSQERGGGAFPTVSSTRNFSAHATRGRNRSWS